MKGSAGSGKSTDTAIHYLLRMLGEPGRNLVAMRKSDITNRDSTYAELTGAIHKMFGSHADDYWEIKSSPLSITCKFNGNKIIFRGMNDEKQREKFKSITFPKGKLTDVWLEEATEFTKADLEIIDDRLRGILPEGLFYQIRLTFNPVSATHWIKKMFFDCEPSEDIFLHQSTYRTNYFIDKAYHRRMLRRQKTDPEGFRIYGLGEWGETGGLILGNWKVVDISTDFDSYDEIAMGQDFGYNHANAILVLGRKGPNLYILDEIYLFEKNTREIIEIAEDHGIRKDVHMWCDSAEPDRISDWDDHGYWVDGVNKGGSKGSVHAQIDWLKQRQIYIHPRCRHTIKEIQQWRYRKDPKTGEYTEDPVGVEDDAMAALRYGIEDWRKDEGWF